MSKYDTREAWLKAATALLDKEFFEGRGYKLPEKIQVAVGFPFRASKAIGQCFSPDVTTDETTHIFVCPSMGDSLQVLATHLHELIHASAGIKEGHRGLFAKLAREFGLQGKLTATYAKEGSELWTRLCMIQAELGPYPHSAMKKTQRARGQAQGGWVRMLSPSNPAYKTLVSPKMLEEFGPPTDPWGDEMRPVGEQ